jgi:hypothetical protein
MGHPDKGSQNQGAKLRAGAQAIHCLRSALLLVGIIEMPQYLVRFQKLGSVELCKFFSHAIPPIPEQGTRERGRSDLPD